jgi:hypothetical protein
LLCGSVENAPIPLTVPGSIPARCFRELLARRRARRIFSNQKETQNRRQGRVNTVPTIYEKKLNRKEGPEKAKQTIHCWRSRSTRTIPNYMPCRYGITCRLFISEVDVESLKVFYILNQYSINIYHCSAYLQVGKVMVQGGGTFGTFMAIGTGIRC